MKQARTKHTPRTLQEKARSKYPAIMHQANSKHEQAITRKSRHQAGTNHTPTMHQTHTNHLEYGRGSFRSAGILLFFVTRIFNHDMAATGGGLYATCTQPFASMS